MEDHDLELVRRARRRDAEAFALLYGKIYKELYKFALYTLRNPQDAEDAVSEAVTDAFAGIGGLRNEEAFRSWMFRILSNKCKRRIRGYQDRMEELPEELAEKGMDFTEGSAVRDAFWRLSGEERLIISLHLFGGYKSREIAELLDMKDGTVRSKESRALAKLAVMLQE